MRWNEKQKPLNPWTWGMAPLKCVRVWTWGGFILCGGCVRGITQSAAACKNLTIIKEEWLLLTMVQLPLAYSLENRTYECFTICLNKQYITGHISVPCIAMWFAHTVHWSWWCKFPLDPTVTFTRPAEALTTLKMKSGAFWLIMALDFTPSLGEK